MTLGNNLAILKLERKSQLRSKNKIRRIKFDRVPRQIPINVDHVTVLGWGAKYPNDEFYETRRLSSSRLNMYHIKDCQSLYNDKYVTSKHFCAGFISKGGGACNRDLGGPGIEDGVLLGVISFGAPVCGTPDAPTVFTKLGYYANWIDTIIEQGESNANVDNSEKIYDTQTTNYDYFREDETERTVAAPAALRIGKGKKNSQEDVILNTMSKMLPSQNMEMPKFLNDLYKGLPKKLINLFAKISVQEVTMKANNKETPVEKPHSLEVADRSYVLTTTISPKVTEGVTELMETHELKLFNNKYDDNSPTESVHELINVKLEDQNIDVSDNYEENLDDKVIEFGMNIFEKSSENINVPNKSNYIYESNADA
ncbi:uncharacterized protein [Battus philenor]|uniref:uncharacterized protein n=1 Tax=Battus philenor TaxID=42288 RepID=UPI0035D10608